ncbi:unnamed protein product [Rotaria sp. Silwood1]|nr:unnamed protein product [Rotaria sp. Silwood1]
MDEAYLIVRNRNYSNNIALFGNKIVCESCDLEKMIVAISNQNATLIIDTKYAYNLELRSLSSNKSLLCQIASYKFAEHGTYILDIMQNTSTTDVCSIKQVGNPSYYWTPAILAIIFVILYTVLVQFWHYFYRSRYFDYFRRNNSHQRLINDNLGTIPQGSPENIQQQNINVSDEDVIRIAASKSGGYWFFDHSIWNGLTLADLVFPWFAWMMGVSIVLSQRSLRSKNIPKRNIFLKIYRRTIILFVLGLSGQSDLPTLRNLRIFGVLQRLATCYFFTAILVLVFEKKDDERDTTRLPIGDNIEQPLRIELFKSVFQYWIQWLFVILIIIAWILITFLLPVPNCPTGYLGPGGKHDHGKYWNCTGAAGYIDRVILGNSHLYDQPTCKEIYSTKIPYDPEGIMGILTGIFLCYLGVQAGHSFVHSTRVRRVCVHWIVSSIICGCLGLGLSHGGHSDSLIPINKNLWSLTFVFILASLAFMILTILYLVVDVRQWFTGAPFLWLGMNSIVIYICHGRFGGSFPVQFEVNNTHAEQIAMHLYGAIFWSFVAGCMYYKKIFIAI